MWNRKSVFAALLLGFTNLPAHCQNSPITVEIKPTRTAVNEREFFKVTTALRNSGAEEQALTSGFCGYGDLWVSDHPSVHVASGSCKKTELLQIKLEPGESYRRNVEVFAKLAPDPGESEWVTFRLGLRGDKVSVQPSAIPRILWSNSVTVKVTRASASSQDAGFSKTDLPADGNGTGGITVTELHGAMNGTPLTLPPAGRKMSYLQTLSAERITLSAIEVSLEISGSGDGDAGNAFKASVAVTNKSDRAIPGPIQVIFDTLTRGVTLANATGSAREGPYITIPGASLLGPGKSVSVDVEFSNPRNETIKFVPMIHSGSLN